MLSVSKMSGRGQGEYYLSLARSDYYTEGGEPEGRWLGEGAAMLGLSGTVAPDDLRSLLAGYAPSDGRALVRNAGDESRCSGMDLTFSAPKSVSVMWAGADERTRQAIQRAHFEAVKAALSYLEQEASVIRRGRGGVETEKAQLIIAAFEHSTSREYDMQLHTHALVMNAAITEDGRSGALDLRRYCDHKMAAGALYRAELGMQLQQRLGVELERRRTWFEVKGVPRPLCDEFSKRREQVVSYLNEKGWTSARGAEKAALDSREAKGSVSRPALFAAWKQVFAEHGFGGERPLHRGHQPERSLAVEKREAVTAAIGELTQRESHFSEKELVKVAAQEAQTRGIGARAVLEAVREELRDSREVVRLGVERGVERFTTRDMFRIEASMLQKVERSRNSSIHSVAEPIIERVFKRNPTITEEQKYAVRHLTQAPGWIAAMRGMAGTGKSFTLRAVREAYELQGYDVHGACLSARAASGLQEGSGIKSTTIARALMELHSGKLTLTPTSVLVVDEAGMVDTRQMNLLIRAVEEKGAKLLLAGDDQQLQPIAAGGPFRAIMAKTGFAQLTTIIRQKDEWARDGVTEFSKGEAGTALKRYAERGLVTVEEDKQQAMSKLIGAWKTLGVWNPDRNLIIASDNADAARLNRMAQEKRKECFLLGEPHVELANGYQVHAGDRIVFRKNARRAGLENGMFATVKGLDTVHRLLKVELDSGKVLTVNVQDYGSENIQLGYAVTTHVSQGSTVANSFVLLGGSMQDLHQSYVQASRAKWDTHFFVDALDAGANLRDIIRDMERSRQKELAHDVLERDREHALQHYHTR